jgi:hypothetical protein
MLRFLKYFRRKNCETICVFDSKQSEIMQNFDHNIGFKTDANFFAENWQKLQKIVIITSTPWWSEAKSEKKNFDGSQTLKCGDRNAMKWNQVWKRRQLVGGHLDRTTTRNDGTTRGWFNKIHKYPFNDPMAYFYKPINMFRVTTLESDRLQNSDRVDFWLSCNQGDQIGRIFAQWEIIFFEQVHENYRSSPHFNC